MAVSTPPSTVNEMQTLAREDEDLDPPQLAEALEHETAQSVNAADLIEEKPGTSAKSRSNPRPIPKDCPLQANESPKYEAAWVNKLKDDDDKVNSDQPTQQGDAGKPALEETINSDTVKPSQSTDEDRAPAPRNDSREDQAEEVRRNEAPAEEDNNPIGSERTGSMSDLNRTVKNALTQNPSAGASSSTGFQPPETAPRITGASPPTLPRGVFIFPNPLGLGDCAAIGYHDGVRSCLDHGGNVNVTDSNRETPIVRAIRGGHLGVVDLLLQRGADVNSCRFGTANESPLELAVDTGQKEIVKLLLHHGARIEENTFSGNTPLHLAAKNGDISLVRLFLDNAVAIDAKSRDEWCFGREPQGGTALHTAVFHGHIEVVRELLARGADVDAVDRWNAVTPLNTACRQKRLDIARILLDHGAKVDGISGGGFPPLASAAAQGNLEMATLFLQRNAQVDAPDTDGDPALHSAACNGRADLVRLLLDHGADVRTRGGSGRTARWFASERKHEAIARLLKDRGADDQHRPDIPDDSSMALQSIGKDKFLAEIEKAQALVFEESRAQHWAQKLRFVTQASKNQIPQYDLEIIEEESGSIEPFVAVSYCWGSVSSSVKGNPLIIRDSRFGTASPKGIRQARARADVILRSFAFAASQGIKRVWIDQECIDQDDEMDVQAAVQAMHLVYRRAAATVVILNKHVHTTEDVAGLPGLVTSDTETTRTVRDRILGDKWFTRAWCTQEYANSNSTTLYFLVGWKDGVDEDGRAWKECVRPYDGSLCGSKQPIFREWILRYNQFWSMSFHSGRYSHVMASHVSSRQMGAGYDTYTLLDEGIEKMEWCRPYLALGRKPDDSECSRAHSTSLCFPKKLRMTMEAAYGTLRGKGNLLTSDRLAILGNMAHYASRINTKKAVDERLSYTACIIALALQNGDLSPLFCLSGTENRHTNRTAANEGRGTDGSWLPPLQLPLDGVFSLGSPNRGTSLLRSHHFSGDPGYVIGSKGLFRGLIWEIEAYDMDGLFDSRDALPRLLEPTFAFSDTEKTVAEHTLLQILIRHLILAENRDLVELVILCALPRQLETPEEMSTLLSRLESWARDGDDESWPSDFFNQKLQPLPAWGKKDKTKILSRNPLLHWIFACIKSNKPLPIGKCVVRSDTGGAQTFVGLFTVDPKRYRKVFTPLSELEYEFGKNPMVHSAPKKGFWSVEEIDGARPSDEDVQKATKLLGEGRDFLLDEKVYRVQGLDDGKAVWSHRLSRNAILKMNDRDGWTIVPLGQDARYIWIL